jgi:hypothetical protein
MPAPSKATTLDGVELDLAALAAETCAAYDAEFPDERERYGPAGMEWCKHDNQHLLNWALLSLRLEVDFEHELAWLARVLETRGFPLARLARDLELLAGTLASRHPAERDVRERLLSGAAFVSSRTSFLG